MLGNINSPINSLTTPRFQKIRLENVFSTFHHLEIPRIGIVFVGLLRDLSRQVKIVHFFFQEDTSRKFLILLLSYFPFFDCKRHLHLLLFSLIVMAFSACTCELVHIQDSFEFLWVVSGLVCRSGSKDICALQHGFLYFLLFLYLYFNSLACIITHLCFLFPQHVPSDLEVGHEKSILTRTEILFYHYLFQRTPVICNFISQENVFLFAIYFH